MNKILIITDYESDLLSIMQNSGISATVIPVNCDTPPAVSDFDALAVLGGCGDSPLIPSPPTHLFIEKMHKAKKPVFCEYVGSILATRERGTESTARQRMVYRGDGFSAEGVEDGDLFDAQSNDCLKLAPLTPDSRPILSYLEYVCAHSHKDVTEEEHKAGKWALWWLDNSTLISSIRLANFHRARFAPTEKCQALITSIIEFLAGEKVTLRFPDPIVEYKKSTVASIDDVRHTVSRGIRWIKNAGLLKADGRLGYDEGYSNRICAKDGHQHKRQNVRADCTGEIGVFKIVSPVGEVTDILIDFYVHNLHSSHLCSHKCQQLFNACAVFYVYYIDAASEHMLGIESEIRQKLKQIKTQSPVRCYKLNMIALVRVAAGAAGKKRACKKCSVAAIDALCNIVIIDFAFIAKITSVNTKNLFFARIRKAIKYFLSVFRV